MQGRRHVSFATEKHVLPERFIRFATDIQKRISRYDMVWGEPSGPPASWREGAPIGNGDFGAMVSGYPDNLSFVLGKTDIWDRSVRKSFFPGSSFAEIRRIYQEQDRKAFEKLGLVDGLPPCQHATTAGMFRLHLQEGSLVFVPEMRVSLWDGTARLSYRTMGRENSSPRYGATVVDIIASRQYRVLAVRVRPTDEHPNCPAKLEKDELGRITWELSRAKHPPHPSAKTERQTDIARLTQKLLPDDSYVVGVLGAGGKTKIFPEGNRITEEVIPDGTEEAVIYIAIVSNKDARNPKAEVTRRLRAAKKTGFEKIAASHRNWWHDYWKRGYICINDELVEKWWYTSLYLVGCITEPGCQSPGLQGVWIKENVPPWYGDYHSNINLESVYWGLLTANRVDHMEPFIRFLTSIADQCRKDTRRYFGMRGIRFPHQGAIDGYELTGGRWALTLGVAVGGSSWLTQLLWQVYERTGDRKYLKEITYPLLKDVVLFYEDYLTWDKEKSRWVLEPSVHFEVYCPTMKGWGRNSLHELCFVHGAFQRAIAASAELDIDRNDRNRWQDILAKLSDLPTDPDGKEWISFEGRDSRKDGRFEFALPPVFSAELVSIWHGPKRWLRLAKNTLASPLNKGGRVGNPWCGGYGVRELVRMGKTEQAFAAARWTPQQCAGSTMPPGINGLVHGWAAPYLQADHGPGMCSALSDMLLLGLGGVIRVFPCFPRKVPAAFHSLRAPGAFLVSAEKRAKAVDYVIVQSLTGRRLRLANPWTGKARILDAGSGKTLLLSNQRELEVDTKKNQVLIVENVSAPYKKIKEIIL